MDRDLRGAVAQFGVRDVGLVDGYKPALGGFAFGFPFADGRLEAIIDVAGEQVLERAPIALRIGGDDHLVGGPGAGDEMLAVKALVLARDGRPPRASRARQCRSSDPPRAPPPLSR